MLLGVIVIVLLIWVLGLSFLIWQNRLFLQKLFPDKNGDFKDRLEEVLKEYQGWENFKRQSFKCLQKVKLARYNPYKDTGGDQSFSIAFLDKDNDGVVITSLHSRAGTRVFAKVVKQGKEDGFEFSEEEKKVVAEAIST